MNDSIYKNVFFFESLTPKVSVPVTLVLRQI